MSAAIDPPTPLARKPVRHHRQTEPAAARSDVGDVRHPGWVGLRRVDLPIQQLGRDRQRRLAVGRVDELALNTDRLTIVPQL
jgi:hypothetical protein